MISLPPTRALIDKLSDDRDHLRAELLVSQQANAELLDALHAIASADALDAAQEIACAAIAIAIVRGER
jgi:hypothetical protein